MFSTIHQKLVWITLVWFAVLQTLSPLIHAHVEADSPEQGHGIHMHVDDIIHNVPTFENHTKNLHTIGIEQAITEALELLTTPLFYVLLILFSLFGLNVFFKPSHHAVTASPCYLRPRSRPRAPPRF